MIHAEATKDQVGSAQAEFEFCADVVDDMEQAADSGNIGKAYNAAKVASHICEARAESITDIRNAAKPDFRVSDCREATMSGQEFSEGLLRVLDAPTAENQGKLETLKSGFQSMAAACRDPDDFTLSRAVRGSSG